VTEYITPDCSYCKAAPVRWCGLFEAVPKLMPFPIDYQWCLCGTVIAEGEGEVPSRTGSLSYKLKTAADDPDREPRPGCRLPALR